MIEKDKTSSSSQPLFSKPVHPWYYIIPILLFGFGFIKITESFIGIRIPPEGVIIDKLHMWTAPINHFFHQSPLTSKTILITTSLWIDASILFLCVRAWFGPTIRPFLELFLFAVVRQSLQFLVSLPIPEGIIWEYPGFPSLMIDYSLQHDLYFSGHTGVTFLTVIELLRTHKKWLGYISLCLCALVVMTIVFFRIHYTMDIFTGFLVALSIIYISRPVSHYIDRLLQRSTSTYSPIDPNLEN